MKKRLILSLLMCGLLFSYNGKDVPNNSNTTNNDQQNDKSSDTEPSEPIQYEEDEQGLAFYPLEDGSYGVGVGRALFLENIVVPSKHNGKNVTKVINHGFDGGFYYDYEPQIKSITLPNTITEIGKQGIYCFESLETINLPKSLKKIGENGLDENYGLKEIHYEGTMDEFSEIDFGKSWLLEEGYNEGVQTKFVFSDKTITLDSLFNKLILFSSSYPTDEDAKIIQTIEVQFRYTSSKTVYCFLKADTFGELYRRAINTNISIENNNVVKEYDEDSYDSYQKEFSFRLCSNGTIGTSRVNFTKGGLTTYLTFTTTPDIQITVGGLLQIIDDYNNRIINYDNNYYVVEGYISEINYPHHGSNYYYCEYLYIKESLTSEEKLCVRDVYSYTELSVSNKIRIEGGRLRLGVPFQGLSSNVYVTVL